MISLICKQYGIENYTVNPDGSIDVNGSVDLGGLDLVELPLTFNKVTGSFSCSRNNLTSLKGGPRWISGDFYCSRNRLTSLEFSPDYVGLNFWCQYNCLIDNYCDTEILGSFYTSLKQDGMIFQDNKATNYNESTNYNEWRKLYKRKKILDDIFKIGV